ncbi:MAG: YkgJ family cysteine cluster protein [bacterium]
MEIETDLKAIERMAEEKEKENWKFRGFLKQLDIEIEELDAIVHRINDEVIAQIDCTECGNCCKHVKPTLDKDDVSKFASGLKISIGEFREKYLIQDADDPSEYTFNALPCPFLENNMCLNYECRPKACASYPHLHKDEFVFRLWGVVNNYSICPIVFNVYERLKSELWHNDDFYEDDLFDFD